jgi:hypothetical protein
VPSSPQNIAGNISQAFASPTCTHRGPTRHTACEIGCNGIRQGKHRAVEIQKYLRKILAQQHWFDQEDKPLNDRQLSGCGYPEGAPCHVSANQYTPYKSEWSADIWSCYCPPLEYRVKKQDDFPAFLPKALIDKFNCGLVAASGNERQQTYVFQGYRVDDKELDEHQYIVTFDVISGTAFGGFVHHADYSGRTTRIPDEMLECIALSGVNVDFRFARRPPNDSGSIKELVDAGLIEGFTNSVKVQNSGIAPRVGK